MNSRQKGLKRLMTKLQWLDSHHDFQCQNDATVISTIDPEGLPLSGACNSSKQTAASGIPSMFASSSPWKQMASHVSGRASLQETGAVADRDLLQQRFQFTVEREEKSRHKRCAYVERQSKSSKNLWTESLLDRPRRDNGSPKIVWSWGWDWGLKLQKEKFRLCRSNPETQENLY